MPDYLDIPISFNPRQPQPAWKRVSATSWISSLAHPTTSPTSAAPPIPLVLDVSSPDSSGHTIKVSHRPPQDGIREVDTESRESESTYGNSDEKDLAKDSFGGIKMSTVEEVSEIQQAPSALLRGKARSIVSLVGSGLRSLPRALSHNSLYDRTVSTRSSYVTSARTTTNYEHEGPIALKFAEGTIPFFLAPPPPAQFHTHPPLVESPTAMSHPLSTSKLDSELEHEQRPGKLTSLLSDITSMPWMSTRVSVDYIPGESRMRNIMPKKTSSSWYTVSADAPSIISHRERLVPEPWFPPPELPTTTEIPGEEERAEAEENDETREETIDRLNRELLAEKAEVMHLKQVVEHHKNTIVRLEEEVETLRREKEEREEMEEIMHRRKSSVRQSLRARDSVRVSTMRRASARVSKGPSFFD